MNVGPSGKVESPRAESNDPAAGRCIEDAVRDWRFPARGSTSTVRVPFKSIAAR